MLPSPGATTTNPAPTPILLPAVLSLNGTMSCRYTDWQDQVFYTADPWCWTSLLSPDDKATTTITNTITTENTVVAARTIVAASTDYCLCPVCYFGSDNDCYIWRPSSSNCNGDRGWYCSVTTSSDRVVQSTPTGNRICIPFPATTSTTTQWDRIPGCLMTNHAGSTSSVSYTAEFDTTTRHIQGGWVAIINPHWKCEGDLCEDSCGNLAAIVVDVLKCIFTLFTKCEIPCIGKFGFDFPPPVSDPGNMYYHV